MSLNQARQRIELKQAGIEYKESHKREFAPQWYPWQVKQFALGAEKIERMTLAGNQTGKTESTTYEHALHMTGGYDAYEKTQGEPWPGLVIDRPGNYFALGVDNKQLRKVLQRKLFGDLVGDRFSGGWIHPDEVLGITRAHGETGLASTITVRHKSGGKSTLSLFAHTQSKTGQGSLNIAGETVDGILCDEQPEDSVIGQLAARRLNGRGGKGGYMLYAMTPERGMTDLVHGFMTDPAAGQVLIGPIAWEECPHITPEVRVTLLASIPQHEREMRSKGIPLFGSGRIFRFDEEAFLVDPFQVTSRPWMQCIRAIDIGINHPHAGAWLAFDPEINTTYLVKTYRKSGENAAVHAAAMNSLWPDVSCVFPHDIENRNPGSGKEMRRYYADAGLLDGVDFENPDGTKHVEPGILAMQEAISEGRFFGFRGQCDDFVEETRTYHRKDGLIVKERDDAISATRYGYQMVARYGQAIINQRIKTIGTSAEGSLIHNRVGVR